MAKNNTTGTILAVALVLLLLYYFRNKLSTASGAPVIASFAGSPTPGNVAGGPAPYASFNIPANDLDPGSFVPGATSAFPGTNNFGVVPGITQGGILATS